MEYSAVQIEQQHFEEEEARYLAEQEYQRLMNAYAIVIKNLKYYSDKELSDLFNTILNIELGNKNEL